MKLTHLAKYFTLAAFALIFAGSTVFAQSNFNYDQDSWNNLSTVEQEKVLENIRFEMLHERNESLQNTLDQLKSYKAVRATLSSDNMLKIPLKTGKLELKAMFQKAKGEITVCRPDRIEAVLDSYRLVAFLDPKDPTKVLASVTGNDPSLPAAPVSGSIKSDGTTAKVTAGADWIEFTYTGNNSYVCRTNKVPVKISGKFVD